MHLLFLLRVLALVVLSYYACSLCRAAWRFNKMWRSLLDQFPSPPVGSWILGHATNSMLGSTQAHRWFAEILLTHGKTVALRLLNRPMVLTCDPYIISAVLDRSLDGVFVDKSTRIRGFNLLNPDPSKFNIISYNTHNPTWKQLRKGTAPAFNAANLKAEFPATVESAMALVRSLRAREGAAVDVDRAAQRQAMDVIGRVGFDRDFGATGELSGHAGGLNEDPFELLDAGLAEIMLTLRSPGRKFAVFTQSYREAWKKIARFKNVIRNMVREVRKKGASGVPPHTIAGHLLQIPDPQNSNKPMSDADLGAQFTVFFVAGVDTTGHTIAWTLYHLTQHPEVMQKVERELEEAGLLATRARPSPRRLEYSDLSRLTYLSWVLKESMRLTPTVAGAIPREAMCNICINGHFFPKGTLIFSAIQGTHLHPDNWDCPNDFIPERWDGEGVEYLPVPPEKELACHVTAWDADAPWETPGAGPYRPSSSAGHKSGPCSGNKANGAACACSGNIVGVASCTGGNDSACRDHEASGSGLCDCVHGRCEHSGGVREPPCTSKLSFECIGMSLAKMNALTTLALLISHFSFRLADRMGGPEGVRALESERISVCPRGGMWLHCVPRL